jgi:hypothetical protein
MKVAPTLQGGLRIDAETPLDWMMLRCIAPDARSGGLDLADRVSAPMADDEGAGDWRDYVVPDLRDGFNAQLEGIERALAAAAGDEPGRIFIPREDAELWYGGLNQARLALEERYHLSAAALSEMTPGKRSAWFRSQFYLHVQSLLLDHVMR